MSGLFSKPKVNIPAAVLPPPEKTPAPTALTDTAQDVVLGSGTGSNAGTSTVGTADAKNQRVSGRAVSRKKTGSTDVLGGIGQSGLNI